MRHNVDNFFQTASSMQDNVTTEHSTTAVEFVSVIHRIANTALRTNQWITVVGGHRDVITALVDAGVSRGRIRWVIGRDDDQREWATEQALLAGTSSVVLSWLGDLSPRTQQRLKMASKVSHTHSYVFNEPPMNTPLH